MNWLDLVLIVFVAVVAVIGYRTGLVQAGATLVGILVGIALASRLHGKVDSLFSFTGNENAQEIGGFILIFALVLLASIVASYLLRSMLRAAMLSWVDSLGGVALGVVIAAAAASAVLANVQQFPVQDLDVTVEDSLLGSFLADNFDVVLRGVRILPKGYGT